MQLPDRIHINPEVLLDAFGDPLQSLAAAILMRALQDLKHKQQRRRAMAFFRTRWFHVICDALELDESTWKRIASEY